jgi:CHAD domain-containing protein
MTDPLLNSKDRQKLETLVASSPSEAVIRRARLLLLLDEGVPTRQAAEACQMTAGRARHWRGLFRSQGMKIFPDATAAVSEQALPGPTHQPTSPSQEGFKSQSAETGPGAALTGANPSVRPGLDEFIAAAADLKAPGVLTEDSLAEAGRKVLRFHFAQMLLHEDGTRKGEDIEELHDMRVATRRMRAGFEVFGDAFTPKALKNHLKGLRATGRSLGSVRDLDVFMEKAEHYLDSLPPEKHADLEPLLTSWAQERETARTQMVAYLDSEKYASFKKNFYEFLSTPGAGTPRKADAGLLPNRVSEIAPVLVYSRLAAVRAFGAILENATLEQFHALRIEFKKLRYTVEFFREVLGEESKAVINELKAVQDHLGDLNDAQVAAQLLRDFLTVWDAQQNLLPVNQRRSPEPVLGYLTYRYAERQRLMQTFQETWNRFSHPDFQHQLAMAISVL